MSQIFNIKSIKADFRKLFSEINKGLFCWLTDLFVSIISKWYVMVHKVLVSTYSDIGVSSITGFGMDKFMVAVQDGMKEYFEEYKVGRFL